MMITQSVAMALAFLLAGLVYFDVASIALVLAIATCLGIVISFILPARHSLISSIVPKDVLPNAIALNSVTINMTKIVVPTSEKHTSELQSLMRSSYAVFCVKKHNESTS